MAKDEPVSVSFRSAAGRGIFFQVAAVVVAGVSLTATGFLMLHWLRPPESAGTASASPGPAPAAVPAAKKNVRPMFRDWPERKPDLVLLLSGEQHGYLQPCGCSRPQLGGLERRYNFLQHLIKDRGWPVADLDLGDVAQRSGPQTKIKYLYSMRALKKLNYAAVGIGQNEMKMPFIDCMAEYLLNENQPAGLAANLQNRNQFLDGLLKSYFVVGGKGKEPRIGVVAVVGPSVAKLVGGDDDAKFDSTEAVLSRVLKDIESKKPDLLVLLYQGTLEEAKACAVKFPQFRIILSLTREEEPPEKPFKAGNAWIVNVGHKGRYVGLVGVFRDQNANAAFDLRYQLAALGEDYETPEGKESTNPILPLLEEYAQEVKKADYLSHYSKVKHPIQLAFPNAVFVGSEKCKKCHKEAHKIWKDSPHAHAYDSLVKAKRPGLRQFDGECVSCHVTGFGYQGGFKNEAETPHLKDNGCENCHGPCSEHVKKTNNAQLHALMNPYRTPANEMPEAKKKRLHLIDQSCQKCHDIDNDVHWDFKKWVEGKIIHMGKE